jgi:hypothetical protein
MTKFNRPDNKIGFLFESIQTANSEFCFVSLTTEVLIFPIGQNFGIQE